MDYLLVTKLIILAIVLVIVGWDAYLLWQYHWYGEIEAQYATFSVVIYESSRRWPVIPFVFGFLAGHIFWQVYGRAL